MAATVSSSASPRKAPQDLTKVLVSAILEWLLISMLFIAAIFSYLFTKFAYYCGLRTPCLLCSRLDHVLGKEKLGYYWDLFCGDHKSEISSLVLCHAHNKLVDVHGMCESCLFSFATINRSNAETYRLLVGKLGDDPSIDCDQDPLLGGHNPSFSSRKLCSCCSQPCTSRGLSQTLIKTNKFGSQDEFLVPLSRAIEHNQKELRKGQDELSTSVRAIHMRDSGLHPLSHVEYTEVKVTSDTESEVQFSDDDDRNALIPERSDLSAQYLEPGSLPPASVPELSISAAQAQIDLKFPGSISVASTVAVDRGLEELNQKQVGSKDDFGAVTEPIFDIAPPSSTAMKAPVEVSKGQIDITGTVETNKKSVAESGESYKGEVRPLTTSETGVETNSVSSNTDQQVSTVLDLGDAYQVVLVSKGKQMPGGLAEPWIGKDASRVTEDLKVLLSQLSLSRGVDQSPSEMMSPRLSANSGDIKASDSSNSFGMHILNRRISLERNESGLSMDGSIVSEIEGESLVDRLKRQVEHDRKLKSALYKELEEERNASAIASDQAMAMITRLQEEKSAIHMEALQQLRMMEEQAEYDNEALQKTDDILTEKEKELQDLEAELEYYRIKYPNESMLENPAGTSGDIQARDIVVDHSESSSVSVHKHLDNGRPDTYSKVGGADGSSAKTSLFDFEDEKTQILQYLEKLEMSLTLFSNNGVNLDSSQQNAAKLENGLPLVNGKGQNPAELCQVTDLASLQILISQLHKRFEALEADRELLKHTVNSLRYGEEGLHFIEDIASYLGELRRRGTRKDTDFGLSI